MYLSFCDRKDVELSANFETYRPTLSQLQTAIFDLLRVEFSAALPLCRHSLELAQQTSLAPSYIFQIIVSCSQFVFMRECNLIRA